MIRLKSILLIYIIFLSLSSSSQVIYQQEDKEIVEQLIEKLRPHRAKTTAELLVLTGRFFMETPYVAHTLETPKEQLVVNLREMDCTTYAENCLAMALTIKSESASFETFTDKLTLVRYRNGKMENYPSRLHYFSDWIYENHKKKLVRDVSEEISKIEYPNKVNFMSTHPNSYKQLKNNLSFQSQLALKEAEISNRAYYYIPEEKLAGFERKLQDGDIIGITTAVEGLDISHVGIILRHNNRVHFMHASSAAERVVLSETTLQQYLLESKSNTGIMVARPL